MNRISGNFSSRSLSQVSGFSDVSRKFSARSNRVSSKLAFSAPPEPKKPARVNIKAYFSGEIDDGEVVLDAILPVKVLKSSPGSAIPRWSKLKGSIKLGGGKLQLGLKKKGKEMVNLVFDIGMVKSIGYKGKKSKDFTLAFYNDDKLVNITCESNVSAANWLAAIFAEVRVQANVFNRILRTTINPTWKHVLKLDSVEPIDPNGIEEDLSQSDLKQLPMEDEEMSLAEVCLREEADLYRFCRGKDHPDTCDAMARLGLWLKHNVRHEESAYWLQLAEEGRKNHGYRMKDEMSPAETIMRPFENTALDQIRNPSGNNNNLDQVTAQKEQNSKADYESRIATVLKALKEHKEKDIEGGEVEATAVDDEFDLLL